jgi:hypothetical protein
MPKSRFLSAAWDMTWALPKPLWSIMDAIAKASAK